MSDIEESSREEVWKMFDQISPYYDWMNRLLSFGIDIHWRNQVALHLPQRDKLRLLDLATGTGDQLIAIFKKTKQVEIGLGIDLSKEMIRIAEKKMQDKPYAPQITLMEGDITTLSIPTETIDCVTISFGIRNVSDVRTCLQECWRVLTPNGRLLILEFSIPKNRLIRALHLLYLRRMIPLIAGWLAKSLSAYNYLAQTIQTFPCGSLFCDTITSVGFQNVRALPLTFGITTLYIGEKSR